MKISPLGFFLLSSAAKREDPDSYQRCRLRLGGYCHTRRTSFTLWEPNVSPRMLFACNDLRLAFNHATGQRLRADLMALQLPPTLVSCELNLTRHTADVSTVTPSSSTTLDLSVRGLLHTYCCCAVT